jgi:parallel beta-helix repeat protein
MTMKMVRICGVAVGMMIAGAAVAGPLDPPVGPVSPSNKTLAEVQPRIAVNAVNTPGDNDATPSLYKITQPGSYYLTGNITGVNGKRGIEIVASGVTLDLNGFDMVGVPGTFDAIQLTDIGYSNITIRNGSIRSWSGNGVNLAQTNVQSCVVEDLRVSGCALGGIKVANLTRVSGCIVNGNIFGTGISGANGCTITNCAAWFTASGGGIAIQGAGVVSGCVAYGNSGHGISVGAGCTITGCESQVNSASGITTADGTTVSGCAVNTNGGSGIAMGAGCKVSDCTVRASTVDGIVVTADCLVTGNVCTGNGTGGGTASGIHVTGNGNRIDGNTASGGPRGIDVGGTNNVIVRNTCRGNTGLNWNIVAANLFGTIVDRSAPSGNAVIGNSATSTMASQDPWANFTH